MRYPPPGPRRPARRTIPATLAFSGLLAGCSTLLPDGHPSTPARSVQPVMTEHSDALACLGRAIERSGRAPVTVYVTGIPDQTVPREYDERRLSSGAAWWLHTAIGKLGTRRVTSTLDDAGKVPADDNHLVLSGAWTQDDVEVGRVGGMLEALFSRVGIELGGQRSLDVIAADFVSVRRGQVIHATGISVALGADSRGAKLKIEDGRREVRVDLSHTRSDGPQFAQRRITEAAVLVHVSRAFGIDYRPCLSERAVHSPAPGAPGAGARVPARVPARAPARS